VEFAVSSLTGVVATYGILTVSPEYYLYLPSILLLILSVIGVVRSVMAALSSRRRRS